MWSYLIPSNGHLKVKIKIIIHESIKKNFSELEISKQYIKFYKSLK